MSNLTLGGLYAYRLGSNTYGWSDQFIFQAQRNFTSASDSAVRFLIYGDFSMSNGTNATVSSLVQELNTHAYDAVFHNGDFAYDLDSDSGRRGDDFLNYIQPVASRLPYMTAQGNHESGSVLAHYTNRFQMPGNASGFYYSFNVGRVHSLVYDTQMIFDKQHTIVTAMMDFIKKDLESFDRNKYPWLVVYDHRPMYCSPSTPEMLEGGRNEYCGSEAKEIRGLFEDMWNQNKVDLVVNSHVHVYERLGPVYKNASMTCQVDGKNLCVGAPSPIYIVTGIPGNSENIDSVSKYPLPFSKAQDGKLGFSSLTVFNETHLLWEQVRSDSFNVSDYLWLIKGNTTESVDLYT